MPVLRQIYWSLEHEPCSRPAARSPAGTGVGAALSEPNVTDPSAPGAGAGLRFGRYGLSCGLGSSGSTPAQPLRDPRLPFPAALPRLPAAPSRSQLLLSTPGTDNHPRSRSGAARPCPAPAPAGNFAFPARFLQKVPKAGEPQTTAGTEEESRKADCLPCGLAGAADSRGCSRAGAPGKARRNRAVSHRACPALRMSQPATLPPRPN